MIRRPPRSTLFPYPPLFRSERRADIAAMLTPEELADYDLRTSRITGRLRPAMTLLDAGEDEFRRIYQAWRSEEHTSELQSHSDLVCRLLLEKKKKETAAHTRLQGEYRAKKRETT